MKLDSEGRQHTLYDTKGLPADGTGTTSLAAVPALDSFCFLSGFICGLQHTTPSLPLPG